jgi:hypothetical protein
VIVSFIQSGLEIGGCIWPMLGCNARALLCESTKNTCINVLQRTDKAGAANYFEAIDDSNYRSAQG